MDFLVPHYHQWQCYYKISFVKIQSGLGYRPTYLPITLRNNKKKCRSEILSIWRTMYIISNIVIVKNVLKSFSEYLPDDNSKRWIPERFLGFRD